MALKHTCETLKPEVLLVPKPDNILGSHQGVGSLPVNTGMVIVSGSRSFTQCYCSYWYNWTLIEEVKHFGACTLNHL